MVVLQLQPAQDGGDGGGASGVGVRWVGGVELVAEMLDQLKRSFWSWDWPVVSLARRCEPRRRAHAHTSRALWSRAAWARRGTVGLKRGCVAAWRAGGAERV